MCVSQFNFITCRYDRRSLYEENGNNRYREFELFHMIYKLQTATQSKIHQWHCHYNGLAALRNETGRRRKADGVVYSWLTLDRLRLKTINTCSYK